MVRTRCSDSNFDRIGGDLRSRSLGLRLAFVCRRILASNLSVARGFMVSLQRERNTRNASLMNISCVLNSCDSRFGRFLPESETLAVFGALDREYRSTERVIRR